MVPCHGLIDQGEFTMSQNEATKIKARISKRIRSLPAQGAADILDDMTAIIKVNESARSTIARIITRSFTGGYWSQSLDFMVMRELGLKAKQAKAG